MPEKTVATPERETSAHELPEQERTSVAVSSGGTATLHTWRNIRLIIGREYKNQVTQRIFIIMSIILLVIVFLAAFIPTMVQFFSSRSSVQTSVVVVNDAGSVAGLNDTALAAYIGTALNGPTGTQTAGTPAFALTFLDCSRASRPAQSAQERQAGYPAGAYSYDEPGFTLYL